LKGAVGSIIKETRDETRISPEHMAIIAIWLSEYLIGSAMKHVSRSVSAIEEARYLDMAGPGRALKIDGSLHGDRI